MMVYVEEDVEQASKREEKGQHDIFQKNHLICISTAHHT